MEAMDADQRKKGHPLIRAGINGKVDYRFVQLIRLLEESNPGFVSVGEKSDPGDELMRFGGSFGFAFPAEDIDEIRQGTEGENPVQVKLNFLSLGGAFGPLPLPYSQLVLEQYNQKDRGIAAFLNTFVHRLASLVFRVKRHYTPSLDGTSVESESFARCALSILGLGNDTSKNRMKVSDRALMGFSSFFLSGTRSTEGLKRLLAEYFDTRIDVKNRVGQWNPIPERYHTRIGLSGENNQLGSSFVLGEKAWLDQSRFMVVVHHLELERYREFLPGETAYLSLKDLVRIYAGDEVDNDLELSLKPEAIPGALLGKAKEQLRNSSEQTVESPRLGWDFYLKTRPEPPADVPKSRLNLNRQI